MYIHSPIPADQKVILRLKIVVFICACFATNSIAQNFELQISTENDKNITLIKELNYKRYQISEKSLFKEVDSISSNLAISCYLNNVFQIHKTDSEYHCIFTPNRKLDQIRIHFHSEFLTREILDQIYSNHTSNYFDLATSYVLLSLERINDHMETLGNSFASIFLTNLETKNDMMSADLNIEISKKRSFDKIAIQGYPEFPKSFINII